MPGLCWFVSLSFFLLAKINKRQENLGWKNWEALPTEGIGLTYQGRGSGGGVRLVVGKNCSARDGDGGGALGLDQKYGDRTQCNQQQLNA